MDTGMETRVGPLGAIKGIFKGIINPVEYVDSTVRSGWGTTLLIMFIVSLLVPFLTFFLPADTLFGGDRLGTELEQILPEFELSEKGLKSGLKFEKAYDKNFYINIDTETGVLDEKELATELKGTVFPTAIYVSSKNIYVYYDGQGTMLDCGALYRGLSVFMGGDVITREDVVSYINKTDMPVIIAVYVVMVVLAFAGFYGSSLIWAGLGTAFSNTFEANLSYGELMRAAIHVRVVWYILKKLLKAYMLPSFGALLWIGALVAIFVYYFKGIKAFGENNKNNLLTGGCR